MKMQSTTAREGQKLIERILRGNALENEASERRFQERTEEGLR